MIGTILRDMSISVPNLLEAIQSQYRLNWYGIHGVAHWARVYENGLRIARGSDANLTVLLLFALFHDSRRENESIDPGHGRRGAELAAEMRGQYFELPDEDFELLRYACETHTDGLTEADLTVQVCWDSDRLDLARVPGISVKSRKMCTQAAKDPDTIAWATERAMAMIEPELLNHEWGQARS